MTNSSPEPVLQENYGYNLTLLARQGMFSPLSGYERLVARIFDVLQRKEKSNRSYNPLLIDEDEKGKTRVMLEVVRRMALGDAPEPFPSFQVIAPNFVALCVSSPIVAPQEAPGNPPESQEEILARLFSWPASDTWSTLDTILPRFEAFFSAAQHAEEQTLLILNDFHRLISQETWPAAIDLFSLLVPALARREIQFIGTSTPMEYQQSIEHLAAIQVRVQGLVLRSDEDLQKSGS